MLDTKGNVKLIDFGFSTQIPNTQKIKLFCGTPSYMAPEIVKKIEFCGPPADIYAAGVLLFAFFCGCFPFRGQDDKDLYKKIASSELVIPDHVPQGPKIIISQMLQKDPENRPTSSTLFQDNWVQSTAYQSLTNSKKSHNRSASLKHRNPTVRDIQSTVSPHRNIQMVATPLSDHRPHERDYVANGMAQNQIIDFPSERQRKLIDAQQALNVRYEQTHHTTQDRKNSRMRSPCTEPEYRIGSASARGYSSSNQ